MGYLGTKPANSPLTSELIPDGMIGTSDLANGAVSPTKLSTGAPAWDTSGNVGIGTSSPTEKLDVSGNLRLGTSAYLKIGTDFSSYIQGTTNTLTFGTNASDRMTLNSSGNLLVNTITNPVVAGVTADHALVGTTGNGRWAAAVRNSGNSTPWGLAVNYNGSAPNNTTQNFLYCYDTVAERFSVRSNGGVANYSGNNVNLSDAREKTNIELAGSYLNKICAIPVKTFNYIDQNHKEDGGLTLGVIAQDVEAVAPELVMESNWGTQEEPKMRLSIYQTDLQYALMKCIQEQTAIINDLKARIEALEQA